eukprot:gene6736-13641_t
MNSRKSTSPNSSFLSSAKTQNFLHSSMGKFQRGRLYDSESNHVMRIRHLQTAPLFSTLKAKYSSLSVEVKCLLKLQINKLLFIVKKGIHRQLSAGFRRWLIGLFLWRMEALKGDVAITEMNHDNEGSLDVSPILPTLSSFVGVPRQGLVVRQGQIQRHGHGQGREEVVLGEVSRDLSPVRMSLDSDSSNQGWSTPTVLAKPLRNRSPESVSSSNTTSPRRHSASDSSVCAGDKSVTSSSSSSWSWSGAKPIGTDSSSSGNSDVLRVRYLFMSAESKYEFRLRIRGLLFIKEKFLHQQLSQRFRRWHICCLMPWRRTVVNHNGVDVRRADVVSPEKRRPMKCVCGLPLVSDTSSWGRSYGILTAVGLESASDKLAVLNAEQCLGNDRHSIRYGQKHYQDNGSGSVPWLHILRGVGITSSFCTDTDPRGCDCAILGQF